MSEHGDYEKTDVQDVHGEAPHMHALTAFMVVVTEDGKSYAILEPPPGVEIAYAPDAASVRRACNEIVDDINCQVSAEYVISKQAEREAIAELAKLSERPANRVADALLERVGKHAADAHLADAFDDGADDWKR